MKKHLSALICAVLIQSLAFGSAECSTYGGKYDHPVVDLGAAGLPVAGGKYKTGDVIEVLFNSSKGWETAVVMPYLNGDIAAGRERWLRAWLPSLPSEVVGVEVMMENVRPGNAANLTGPEEWYSGKVSSIVDAVLSQKFGSGKSTSQSGNNATGRAEKLAPVSSALSTKTSPTKTSPTPTNNSTAGSTTNNDAQSGPIPGGVSSKPAMNGSLPNLAGTAWKQLYEKNVNVVPVFLFCKSGHWEVVRYSLAAGMMGSWRASGNTLTLTNSTDGKSENYSMTYNAGQNLLLLNDGHVTLRLLYNGTTQCK